MNKTLSLFIASSFFIALNGAQVSDDKWLDIKVSHVSEAVNRPNIDKNRPDDGKPPILIRVMPSEQDKEQALYYSRNVKFNRKLGKMVAAFEKRLEDREFFNNPEVEECAKTLVLVDVLRKELGKRERGLWTTQFSLSDRVETAFRMLKKFVPEPKD